MMWLKEKASTFNKICSGMNKNHVDHNLNVI